MARPKGIKQKKKVLLYWLPKGVQLKDTYTEYNKSTKLQFNDSLFRVWDCEKIKLVYK